MKNTCLYMGVCYIKLALASFMQYLFIEMRINYISRALRIIYYV